jgi:hypothetical protein
MCLKYLILKKRYCFEFLEWNDNKRDSVWIHQSALIPTPISSTSYVGPFRISTIQWWRSNPKRNDVAQYETRSLLPPAVSTIVSTFHDEIDTQSSGLRNWWSMTLALEKIYLPKWLAVAGFCLLFIYLFITAIFSSSLSLECCQFFLVKAMKDLELLLSILLLYKLIVLRFILK